MRKTALLLVAAMVSLFSPSLLACSTFCLTHDEEIVFGRNYDFETGVGMLVVNKRGVSKVSAISNDRPAAWISRFGSVTFNQFGREFPMGGMNEEGLVVELLWLEGTVYPPPDDRPAVALLEWIQYQLDNSADVDEMIANNQAVRIKGRTPLHFLVSDARGESATVEFLNGKSVIHRGPTLPVAVLTNTSYATSASHLTNFSGFGGTRPIPASAGSLERFVRVASMLQSYEPSAGNPVEYAFTILESAAQPNWTRWSIVYDIARRALHFRTETAEEIKTVDFAKLDFSCRTPVVTLDLHAPLSGDVSTLLEPYSRAKNYALILEAHRATSFLRNTSIAEIEADAAHPDSTSCSWAPRRRAVRR